MVNIAVAEDDPIALETLQGVLGRYAKEHHQEFALTPFSDGLKFLNGYKPSFDLVFLDINMPNLNGLDAAKKLRQIDPMVVLVFVTDLAQYAIRGYEVDAFDFIIKPLTYDAFCPKMDRIIRRLSSTSDEVKLKIKNGDDYVVVPASNITYIEILDHEVYFHTVTKTYSSYSTLSQVEKMLPGKRFARCNHCFLVNLARVEELKKDDVVVGGKTLKISRSKKKEFVLALTQFLGSVS